MPDQREMVANYRCNEIKEEAIALIRARIEDLKNQCDLKIIEDFGQSCNSVVKEADQYFREKAKQYNKEVFGKILEELTENILAQLYHCFDSQLKLIRQYTYDKVVSEVKKLQ